MKARGSVILWRNVYECERVSAPVSTSAHAPSACAVPVTARVRVPVSLGVPMSVQLSEGGLVLTPNKWMSIWLRVLAPVRVAGLILLPRAPSFPPPHGTCEAWGKSLTFLG